MNGFIPFRGQEMYPGPPKGLMLQSLPVTNGSNFNDLLKAKENVVSLIYSTED